MASESGARRVPRAMRLSASLLLSAGFLVVVPAQPALAGPVNVNTLAPTSIVDATGGHTGQVSALAVKDQSGGKDDPTKYVRFGAPGERYSGYRSYTLAAVPPSEVTTITLAANYRGPIVSSDEFTWSIFDWPTSTWVRLGNQNHCGGDTGTKLWPCNDLNSGPWKSIQYNALGTLSDYVDGATGEVRIRLASTNSSGAAKLDYESLSVYSNTGVVGDLYEPALNTRWQWQLQANAGVFPATNGINVDVCQPTFRGGPCVKPDMFDIDPYVDHNIAGRYNYPFDTAAVDAIHASGRHVLGYITAGDIERFRPDYQQFVDFDQRCGGCLIGRYFSAVFPDEFWANLNNGQGQRDLMLQMIRARVDKVAAAGFDGIEFDIVDTYANGKRTTGWHVNAHTQLRYNKALAAMAHADGLSAALKNDGGQIPDLLPYFDYAINEQCFQYHECAGGGYAPGWRAFVRAGKAVFNAEYRIDPSEFCKKANSWNFNSILKAHNFSLFDLPWTPCR